MKFENEKIDSDHGWL